ncbi:growth/cell cycle/stress response regulation protein, putative [Candida dubliniensis CD36]|uniref:Growth/cell cycle/stress response regulation protein, putative n=1 Tax=Candida dubliniensis (strain CD36 / ATCC MYA-646 / CBS 7987 / NCPF 3949 / NRRL Y-17841) TaxID=573826 RepID=B9WJI5_CANDC|nr:growth/cell cycle/stress response regulation protein, putative [Candida dubliniensis CD36]CAX40629.1 growth/cell cycle/stress response regulation protein, putative [Candida dubliniensis CD36]
MSASTSTSSHQQPQDIITQVTPHQQDSFNTTSIDDQSDIGGGGGDYNSIIHLNIRGKEFTITRDDLMSLPESILLCLFPNGVFLDVNGNVINNLTEDDIVYVNFDPQTFQYIINTFYQAQQDLIQMSSNATSSNLTPVTSHNNNNRHHNHRQENILETKPAIIVLREDLDFYVIPPFEGLNNEQMKQLKLGVSIQLLKNKLIFSGLGYKFEDEEEQDEQQNKSSKGLGPAEQHLFDMLCSSGFEVKDKWGCRSLEPNKCVVSSLSLVRLKTNPPPGETPPDSPSLDPVTSQSSTTGGGNGRSRSRSRIAQLASSASRAASRSLSSKRNKPDNSTQTKLLLFWRKPARKCWWSHDWVTIEIDAPELFKSMKNINLNGSNNNKMSVKVHIRRVWTLELSIIGVQ